MELRRRLKQGEALGDAAECVEPRPCQEDQPTKLSKKELERFEEKLKTGRQL